MLSYIWCIAIIEVSLMVWTSGDNLSQYLDILGINALYAICFVLVILPQATLPKVHIFLVECSLVDARK